jgi:hypothetical protein
MKVFVSWSGDISLRIGTIISEWFPLINQHVAPFLSKELEKGTRWLTSITTELASCNFGLICLTQDNLEAPWIHFEAGALSKVFHQSGLIIPLLYKLKPSDIRGPLTQFQAANLLDRNDMLRVMKSINSNSSENEFRNERQLEQTFTGLWGNFQEQLSAIPDNRSDATMKEHPVSLQIIQQIIEELLVLTRQQSQLSVSSETIVDAMRREIFAMTVSVAREFRSIRLAKPSAWATIALLEEVFGKWKELTTTWSKIVETVPTDKTTEWSEQILTEIVKMDDCIGDCGALLDGLQKEVRISIPKPKPTDSQASS